MVSSTALQHATHAWHTFAAGARVYDHESGEDGVVTGTTIVHATEPRADPAANSAGGSLFNLPDGVVYERVTVGLDGGETVTRDAAELVQLPPGLEDNL